jgi:hypothetical protein
MIQDYKDYIIKNELDIIWTTWSNPSSGEIRTAAYKPIYTDSYAAWADAGNKKCTKKNCTGIFVISDDDKKIRIMNKWRCNVCTTKKDILYRDVDASSDGRKKPKLYFGNRDTVRFYAGKGRTFYSTLIVYDKKIIDPYAQFSDVSLMKSVTLGIDIDLKNGCITDAKNREELQKTINIIREKFLDKIVPGSYNIQTSGNGVYILIHHLLVQKNVFEVCTFYNVLITELNKEIENDYVKLDALNGPSRVFKLVGSIHQAYDIVAIPLKHDVNLTKMSENDFKLKNFNIENYKDKNGNLEYYTRCDMKDSDSLYEYLKNNFAMLPTSSPRAMRAAKRGDIDETKWAEKCAEFMKKEAWIMLDVDMPGEVYYRIKDNGLEMNLFRIPEEDKERVRIMVRQKVKEHLMQKQISGEK